MKEYTLNGTKREAVGKKASKEMRKQGLVPCNIYGENNVDGKPEAFAFSIPASEIRKVVYTPHIYVVNLNIDGKLHKAIIKELQFLRESYQRTKEPENGAEIQENEVLILEKTSIF